MDLWDLLLSILWFMLLLAWFSLLFAILSDVFGDHDLSGWAKAGWCTFVILMPWLGVIVYLIVRGRSMGERASGGVPRNRGAYGYGPQGAAYGGTSVTSELSRLADLRERGLVTAEQYEQAKAQTLGTRAPAAAPERADATAEMPA
jgi:hypothetical protein